MLDGANDSTVELARLADRLETNILPFWCEVGFDDTRGLFHERFRFDGTPVDEAPRRAMVQARQIFVFSRAASDFDCRQAVERVEQSLSGLLTHYGSGQQGFAFAVHPDGTVQQPMRDSYTHAFILFALAAAHRLTGEARLRSVAEDTLEFMDHHLWDAAHGGLRDRHPDPADTKAQNPQMHLLEALLALHERFPDGPFLDRAGRIVILMIERMLDPEKGLLAEYFHADWSHRSRSECHFEPGHHFEWIWLLDRYAAASGESLPKVAERLWRSGRDAGLRHGLVVEEVGFDLAPIAITHRLWPHAEGVKAAAIRSAAGDKAAADSAAGMLRALNDVFLGRPFPAGWVDRVDGEGRPLTDTVPASSLYHLYGAWTEAERVFGAP